MSITPFEKRRADCTQSVEKTVGLSVENTLRNTVIDASRTPSKTPSEKRLEQQTTDNKQQTTINHQLSNLRNRHLSNARTNAQIGLTAMQHKITPAEAAAITKLVTTLQPGWGADEFLSKLADVREQHDFPEFMAQLTQCALAGLMIDEALAPVVPHVCPPSVVEQTSRDIDWLEYQAGSAAPVHAGVVNEDDISKSVLLKKKRPADEIVRPPSDDPTHWRNRFAADIERGKQLREQDLRAARAEALPDAQPATAAAADHDQRPDQPQTSPDAHETVPNQIGQTYSWGPDDYEDFHDR